MVIDIEINNIYGKILTNLTIDQLAVIQRECQFKVEGSEYKQMAFRNKRRGGYEWDGYRKLFNIQTRRFPIGLLSRILKLLEGNGLQVSIVNKRAQCGEPITYNYDISMLRKYQFDTIMKSLMYGNGIVKVATGGGKTIIAGCTIGATRDRSIFIVHTRDLLYQAKSSFERLFIGEKIGQIGDGIIDYQNITVATMQTLAILGKVEVGSNKYDEDGDNNEKKIEVNAEKYAKFHEYSNTVRCVMMDEVQIVCSQTAYGVRFLFEYANRAFGYSASPWRDDGSDLMIEGAFGERIVDITASELIRQGFLVKPTIIIKEPNYQTVPMGKKDNYNTIYSKYIVDNIPRNLQVANDAMEYFHKGLNTLILVTQIKHGEALQDAMAALGMPAIFISGKSGMKRRKQAIEDMRNGRIQLMIASTIADVGLDIPRLDCIVEAGAGKSSVTALQRLGRIMRPFGDKKRCYFITYRDSAPIIRDHINRKIEIWRTEPEFEIMEVG
jgi:superfamily II DNA or RNA helicase